LNDFLTPTKNKQVNERRLVTGVAVRSSLPLDISMVESTKVLCPLRDEIEILIGNWIYIAPLL